MPAPMNPLRAELARALRHIDGAPAITGLPCDALTSAGADYMRRYYLAHTRDRSLRYHHILRSDPGRVLHDHPWDYATALIEGGYTEVTPDGQVRYDAPCVLLRRAEQPHRLVLDAPAWTLIACGPPRRRWGFHTPAGWVHWRQYPEAGAVTGCAPPRPLPGSRRW